MEDAIGGDHDPVASRGYSGCVTDAERSATNLPSRLRTAGHRGAVSGFGLNPTQLDAALGASERLAEWMPEDFAPPWYDSASGRLVVDTASSLGATLVSDAIDGAISKQVSLLAKLNRVAADPDKKGPDLGALSVASAANQLVTRTVEHSGQTLEATKHALTELSSMPDFIADNIWMTRIDPRNNRVIMTVSTLSPTLAQTIAMIYGTDLVAVEIAQDDVAIQPAAGRWLDYSAGGFYGGARLSLGCTDAFSWYSGSTNMMLTAGHCIPSGGPVSTTVESMGTVASGSRENWSTSVGTQYLVGDLSGTNVYRGDMALVSLTSGKTSAGRIYRGDSESNLSRPVAGMISRRAASGDQFCTGGSSRKDDGSAGPGEICGWSVDVVKVDYQYATGHWWRNVVRSHNKSGWCNRPGDSGAPIYFVNSNGSVLAKGILDGVGGGGSDYYAGVLDLDQCSVLFTDIYEPWYGLPGSIRTG